MATSYNDMRDALADAGVTVVRDGKFNARDAVQAQIIANGLVWRSNNWWLVWRIDVCVPNSDAYDVEDLLASWSVAIAESLGGIVVFRSGTRLPPSEWAIMSLSFEDRSNPYK